MGTTQVTGILFQLQQIDLEIDRLAAETQTIATSLQGNAELRRRRTEYDTALQQLHSGQQTQKEAEWTLEDLTKRLNQQEQRLYNGSVSNAKELQGLQLEAQRLRAQQNREEDRLLELIDTTESLQENERQRNDELKYAENAWEEESRDLHTRQEKIEESKKELQAKKASLQSGISAELLKRYEGMRRTKQGRAISKVEQNSCQWCRVILTPSELQQVRISPDLQTCTNCGRILYYER